MALPAYNKRGGAQGEGRFYVENVKQVIKKNGKISNIGIQKQTVSTWRDY